MARGREFGAWALLIVFGVLLGGAMIEAGVRVLHLVPDRFWEPDALLGTRHIAGRTGWWTQEEREFRVPVRINRQGLRDVDHEYAKPPGITRVLILGDSFIEALQVSQEQMVGRRLEAMLGSRAEVISAGVSGYGTASELLFWQHEGMRYDPDAVVLAFYPGNDVKNNSPTLEDLLAPVYTGDDRLERVQGRGDRGAARRQARHPQLRAYQFARQLVLRHPGLMGPLNRVGLAVAEGPRTPPVHNGVPVDYWVFAQEPDAEWSVAWQHTERLLGELHDAVVASGRRFVILVVPSRYEIYPEWWEETVAAHPAMRGHRWDVAAPPQRVLAWCRARAVTCLELAGGLRTVADGGERLYFHYDGHWTAAGHERVARLLADFLREQQIVRFIDAGDNNEVP